MSKPTAPGQATLGLSPLVWRHSRAMVTIKDVAEAFGISPARVYELLDLGELDHWPIGGTVSGQATREHVRIIKSSAEAWFYENYFLKHGREYPAANTEEVLRWRAELRKLRSRTSGNSPVRVGP